MMDELLLNFVRENLITIGFVLAILKVIAKETPWALDDRIVSILTGYLRGRKNGNL